MTKILLRNITHAIWVKSRTLCMQRDLWKRKKISRELSPTDSKNKKQHSKSKKQPVPSPKIDIMLWTHYFPFSRINFSTLSPKLKKHWWDLDPQISLIFIYLSFRVQILSISTRNGDLNFFLHALDTWL